VHIDPVFFNFTFNHCGLWHDEAVDKKSAELALSDLSLQAAPALRIWHYLRRRRWK
jgi:hypothetical protein